tara:strand:- start:543 stop:1586 length:1044 start_codon:yes stop_codon:yes gene_type:complete
MIKIDPVEFENFTMSLISDEENGFSGVLAISNKKDDSIPLVEIKFESYNSSNQQIDVTKKYAQTIEMKYTYNDIKNKSGVITVNVSEDTKFIKLAESLSNFLNTQYKDQISVYTTNVDEDFYYHLSSICPQLVRIDQDAYTKAQAKGAFYSSRAVQQFMNSNKSFQHKHVIIQGVSNQGKELAKMFDKNNANLTVCDTNKENINDLYAEAWFGTCSVNEATTVMSDLLVICDGRETLDKNSTQNINALAVIGVSDCQLASNKAGYNMHGKRILYIPDYVAGAGGVIMIAKQLEGNKKSLEKELDKIFTRTLSLLNHSNKLRKPPFIVAEQQMQEKIKNKKQVEKISQ